MLGDEVQDMDGDSRLLGAVPELDSVGIVSVLTAMEEDLGIAVEDDEISAEVFETLGTLCAFIESKVG
jgi:acyl carrier protein